MTTPQPSSTREAAINPNVLPGVLLTAILAASIMGFFHLDSKIGNLDSKIGNLETRMAARFDRLTELLLSGKVKVTVE